TCTDLTLVLLMMLRPPRPTLFPYTTLFRSVEPGDDPSLELALRIGALCNDSERTEEDGRPIVLGDPTEGALAVAAAKAGLGRHRSEEHTSELQSRENLVCRLLLEKKKEIPG